MSFKPYSFPVNAMLNEPGACVICDRNFEDLLENAETIQAKKRDEKRLADLERRCGCMDEGETE